MRQTWRFVPGPAAGTFHENLAGAVDDDFGQGLICQKWSQWLEIARQHEPAAIAFDGGYGAHFVTTAGAARPLGMVRSKICVRLSIRRN